MGLFPKHDLYATIGRNLIHVRDITHSAAVSGSADFSTTRLLIGEFTIASTLLSRLVKELSASRTFAISPRLLIHQTDLCDGGLSEVEHRVLVELAEAAGARKTVVWVGPSLSDQEVRDKLD